MYFRCAIFRTGAQQQSAQKVRVSPVSCGKYRGPAWHDEAGTVYVGRNEDEARKRNNPEVDVVPRQMKIIAP